MQNKFTIIQDENWISNTIGYVAVPEEAIAWIQVPVSDWVHDILTGDDEDRKDGQMRKILYGKQE